MSKEIIERAPDKMMDYVDHTLVLAYRSRFLYFDVSQAVKNKQSKQEITVAESDIHTIRVQRNKKIICL